MLRIGLTGGIGSGKSTVVAMLRDSGLAAIEADDIARELTRPGQPAYADILESFGNDILQPNGEIDRPRLAAIVFASPEKLERLNRIVHPRVVAKAGQWLEDQMRAGAAVAIVEAPLLVEAGYQERFDRLVVVWCRPEQQVERLTARGMSLDDVKRRTASQLPIEEKRRLADDVIDNSGTPYQTRTEVAALVKKLLALAANRRESSGEGSPARS